MIVSCPQCGARYKIQDELLGENGKRVKCKKCESVFKALSGGESVLESAGQASTAEARPAAPAAPPKSPEPQKAPAANAATKPSAGSATPVVKVDNSRVNDYLKTLDDRTTAAVAPTRPIAVARPQQPAVGATIQIDRSQIDAFLRQAQGGASDPVQLTAPPAPKIPPPSAAPVAPVAPAVPKPAVIATPAPSAILPPAEDLSGATIRADRSQINAFLQQNQLDPQEDLGMATIKADRSQIDAFLKGDTSATIQVPQEAPREEEDTDDFSGGATMRVTPEQLAKAFGGEKPKPTIDPSATLKVTLPSDFSSFSTTTPGEPAFPSDDQLGLSDTDSTDPLAAPDFPLTSAPQPQPAPPPTESKAQPQTSRYKAQIEGQVYDELALEDLERWIREARLLDNDSIALMGSENYKPANSYREIAALFSQIASEETTTASAPAKKGFFAWLRGLFSKG